MRRLLSATPHAAVEVNGRLVERIDVNGEGLLFASGVFEQAPADAGAMQSRINEEPADEGSQQAEEAGWAAPTQVSALRK
jgi:hypothetical protein